MDWWEWTKVIGGFAAAALVLVFSAWMAGLAMSPGHPRERGYEVEGVAPVDLAVLQRRWPAGSAPGERERMMAYLAHIDEAGVPMPSEDGAGPAPPPPDLGTLLAAADPASGERAAQVCASCHTFDAGGPDRVGPNLNAIVGKPVAGVGGFAYSEALETHGGRWTYELLDEFLARPARAVPGTRMAFAGIRNPRDRANLIAWLASETPSAPPFPAPRPAEAREKDEVASAR